MEAIKKRISKLRSIINRADIDTMMILSGENRYYLSGYSGEDSQFDETAGILLITRDDLVLVTDSRFDEQARNEAPLYEVICQQKSLAEELPGIFKRLGSRKIGFEGTRLSCSLYDKFIGNIESSKLEAEMVMADELLDNLRIIKDEAEIVKIKNALSIAESAFTEFKNRIKLGMSEKEASWILEMLMRERGAESLSFPSIIASGPNSALPHAVPGTREFARDENILIDWGAKLDGYCSDSTRTLFTGEPDDFFLKVYDTVNTARSMATDSVRPGMATRDVDKIARDHIYGMGFKGKFGHGLGHGTGLAVHEPPRVSPLKSMVLEAGMVITVEPGIYIAGWGGVRIENMVLVKEDGHEVLNKLSCDDFFLNP